MNDSSKDTQKKKFRIDMFYQLRVFYEMHEQGQPTFTKPEIALFAFLLFKGNKAGWPLWLDVPIEAGMHGSAIGNKHTYYKTLTALKNYKLLDWSQGIAGHKAPSIHIPDYRNLKAFQGVYMKNKTLEHGTSVPPVSTPTNQRNVSKFDSKINQLRAWVPGASYRHHYNPDIFSKFLEAWIREKSDYIKETQLYLLKTTCKHDYNRIQIVE